MTEIGTVIDGKYEILKEIGRGGMSVVYLAMDKRLNKQWAVKEIRKKGSGKNDEIVVNSLLAEANLMKRLDHPALPRIVDIIDNGITIYVVMDYIEGESLDKIINEYGAQPEDLVIGWAKQLCDALSYLHSQKPPIIYRDMKPANVMLKPEGNIKIIDFGIAREYKEQSLADTTVLGTKGYAPPEQYSGQTDARSDIYALGMTMHHLLTGVDPRNGDPYAPVRQWNPELSEGIEIIIDKCVQPAAENRYQSCADLLYDLEHPELITKGFKRKQKRKLGIFLSSIILCVVMLISGVAFRLAATSVNNQDYEANIATSDPDNYYTAITIYPSRVDAYEQLIEYYKSHEVEDTANGANNSKNTAIIAVGNAIEANAGKLDTTDPEVAQLYYDMGKLYFSEYSESLKQRAAMAKPFFQVAAESEAEFDKKEIATVFYSICSFMTQQSATKEKTESDYEDLIQQIQSTMKIVDQASDNEANYDKICFYYVSILLLNDQANYMASTGVDQGTVTDLMNELYNKAVNITSSLSYVQELQTSIQKNYDTYLTNIEAQYNQVAKKAQMGGQGNG